MQFHIFWRDLITDKLSLAAHARVLVYTTSGQSKASSLDRLDRPPAGRLHPEPVCEGSGLCTIGPVHQPVRVGPRSQETYAYPPLSETDFHDDEQLG